MSKRAEEAALKAYPVEMTPLNYLDLIEQFGGKTKIDVNTYPRYRFQEGYEQAEKDLALTIADIYRIHIFLYAVKNNKQGAFTFQGLKDEQYQEVLDRFNKAKEE